MNCWRAGSASRNSPRKVNCLNEFLYGEEEQSSNEIAAVLLLLVWLLRRAPLPAAQPGTSKAGVGWWWVIGRWPATQTNPTNKRKQRYLFFHELAE